VAARLDPTAGPPRRRRDHERPVERTPGGRHRAGRPGRRQVAADGALGGTLDDQQIRDVIAFVRSLADPPYAGPPL